MGILSLLGNIGSSSVRALARNLFPGFYEQGLSANAALNTLREAGLGYRRQDFLNDFRQGQASYDDRIRVRYVNRDNTPSEGILEELYHGVPDRYSFVFKAEGQDGLTGEDDTRYFFYHRNSLAPRGEMEQDALSWYSGNYEKYQFEGVNISLVEGYINPVWS